MKGRAPKTGYDRSRFGAGWTTTPNGCNTREVVLRRDISSISLLAGSSECTVVGGRLADPYTGERVKITKANISTIDIDHVVSLSDAWQKGAQQWADTKRIRFANDLRNLLATGQSINAAKGDNDTASWLPPNRSYRCAFVARQVTVKTEYGLAVTEAEKEAMRRVLTRCPRQRLISSNASRPVKDRQPSPSHHRGRSRSLDPASLGKRALTRDSPLARRPSRSLSRWLGQRELEI